MASGFISVVAAIPWGKVVENTPKVFAAASKLVENIRSNRAAVPVPSVTGGEGPVAMLAARINAVEERASALEAEMATASQLLKELAVANAALVYRTRLMVVSLAISGVAVLLAAGAIALSALK